MSESGDRLIIEGLILTGRHGVLAREQRESQPFRIDLELGVSSLRAAAERDDLAATVNYAQVVQAVTRVISGPSRQLLETLAEAVSWEIMTGFPAVQWVRVRVMKTAPPLPATVSGVGVEILRRRGG